jgi:hypothetical protein
MTRTWLAWAAALWVFPASMLLFVVCFGRSYPWPELGIDLLFALNCLTAYLYIEGSRRLLNSTGLLFAILLAVCELLAAACMWILGGLPASM